MTEQTPETGAGLGSQESAEKTQNVFQIQRIYVKDLSFESPASPKAFKEEWKPKVNLNINNRSLPLGDDLYEVVLKLSITATKDDKPIYLAEVDQAGIFKITGLDRAKLAYVLGVACPNVLFPYARETVDSLAQRGSFPALMLGPVNFDQIYRSAVQQQAEREAEQKAAETAGEEN